jgi:hypothetical protein
MNDEEWQTFLVECRLMGAPQRVIKNWDNHLKSLRNRRDKEEFATAARGYADGIERGLYKWPKQ